MEAMTTEQMIEDGKQWARLLLKTLPPQELLALFVPEEPKDFSPEQLLQGANPETMAILAQQWMKRGMERGIERGMEQGMERGIERGMERGMERGVQRGVEQVARRLLASHNVVTVSEWTGLPIERVEEIKQELEQAA